MDREIEREKEAALIEQLWLTGDTSFEAYLQFKKNNEK